ncbi:hypothetical protein SAMN05192552_1008102 [Natrinema hispanicum]|uniref:Uncharacterized protein n=1 Tax=Natrinema hispanicum TaxID=392421 RepID=A0A1I0DEW3_9EURY|nr:hypothetical protein SAMN05192552_1008102 [Natrinema hispanicum]SET30809.1 hypothetical protein SAMN04488694_105131 [Natrinema hispanicum]
MYPSVPGMGVLVPPIALSVGALAGLLVYRTAKRQHILVPRLWAGLIGIAFFLAPIILTPVLLPVYYSLFVPSGPSLVVKPLHALATVIGGGSLVGLGVLLIFFGYTNRYQRREHAP